MRQSAGLQRCQVDRKPQAPTLVKRVLIDSAYGHSRLMGVAACHNCVMEVVRKPTCRRGFQVWLRRWMVERAFGQRTRCRRLTGHYKGCCGVSKAMIQIGMSALLIIPILPS
jgi:transposase